MNPSNSSSAKESCVPVSSNCVIWQGPKISCINLCPGDTISDVTFKLATLICQLQDELDLSELDLSCINNKCDSCPNPDMSLMSVLNMIISYICSGNGQSSASEYQVGPIYNLTSDQITAIINAGGTVQYV